MELTYALVLAADHYRDGSFSPAYAAERIEQIRALLLQYHPGMTERWARSSIPPLGDEEYMTTNQVASALEL